MAIVLRAFSTPTVRLEGEQFPKRYREKREKGGGEGGGRRKKFTPFSPPPPPPPPQYLSQSVQNWLLPQSTLWSILRRILCWSLFALAKLGKCCHWFSKSIALEQRASSLTDCYIASFMKRRGALGSPKTRNWIFNGGKRWLYKVWGVSFAHADWPVASVAQTSTIRTFFQTS